MSVAISHNQHVFGWKAYSLLKKKAMAQELSWTGLVLNLSIAFFIVVGCACILRLAQDSVTAHQEAQDQPRIEMVSIARALFSVPSAEAAANEYQALALASASSFRLVQGQQVVNSITFKNTGTKTWRRVEVTFETGPFMHTGSKFQGSGWADYYMPARLPKDIKPGESVKINFNIKAPSNYNKSSFEDYQLVVNGQTIPGSSVRQTMIVKATPANMPASLVSATKARTVTPKASKPSGVANSKAEYCIASVSSSEYKNCNSSRDERGAGSVSRVLDEEPIIRVGLFSTQLAQRLTASRRYDVYAGSELLAEKISARSTVIFGYDTNTRKYSLITPTITKYVSQPLRLVPEDAGIVTILDYRAGQKTQDNAFRGNVEFRYVDSDKAVWLINELPLDDYIKGLGETTNASPVEFQKVMATVSRTYALYHYLRGVSNNLPDASTKHATQHFHVDSVYDQVYRGYNSELRLTGLTEAVEETRGMVVTYNGKPVVTPYFSNSDGRTRSYKEVWGGTGMDWLVSVPVPEDKGKTLYGHGVGMSARGALLMVIDGDDWRDVLEYYYTGTVVGKAY